MQVLGKLLVGEIFGMQLMCCRLKGQDAMTKFMIALNSAMDGQDTDRFPFSFFDRQGKYVDALLTVNKRTDAEGSITGVFCFLHTTSVELLQVRPRSFVKMQLHRRHFRKGCRCRTLANNVKLIPLYPIFRGSCYYFRFYATVYNIFLL